MLVGHYSASFLAKAIDQRIPLWLLFVAAQLVDIGWAIFTMIGIERYRIVPGFTGSNPLDLYFMPLTHALVSAVAWAAGAALIYQWAGRRWAGWGGSALLVGATVLSHWLLDLLVHVPDLPLYGNQHKVGLGLWQYPGVAFALESVLLLAALALYVRRAQRSARVRGMWIFGLVMLVLLAGSMLGQSPPSTTAVSLVSLMLYLGLAAAAYFLERPGSGASR